MFCSLKKQPRLLKTFINALTEYMIVKVLCHEILLASSIASWKREKERDGGREGESDRVGDYHRGMCYVSVSLLFLILLLLLQLLLLLLLLVLSIFFVLSSLLLLLFDLVLFLWVNEGGTEALKCCKSFYNEKHLINNCLNVNGGLSSIPDSSGSPSVLSCSSPPSLFHMFLLCYVLKTGLVLSLSPHNNSMQLPENFKILKQETGYYRSFFRIIDSGWRRHSYRTLFASFCLPIRQKW